MKTSFILAGAGILVVAVLGLVLAQYLSADNPEAAPPAQTLKPWIDVSSGKAFSFSATGEVLSELKSGDEIARGAVVGTDTEGRASIYFPEGSVVRLDGNSKIEIKDQDYSPEGKTLTVRIKMLGGRMWSKVWGVLTPASVWEVETSNAVATVRGTAFGTIRTEGRSVFIGSESEVMVRLIDPQTGQPFEPSTGKLSPRTSIVVTDARIPELISKKAALAAAPLSPDPDLRLWLNDNEKADDELESELKELDTAAPNEIKKALQEEIFKSIPLDIEDKNELPDEKEVAPSPSPAPPLPAATSPAASSITLITSTSLTNVTEGDTITFKALLTLNDGNKKDVTAEADWQVVGEIGKFSRPGVFVAGLGPTVAEFGTAQGSVVVSFTDKTTGKTFFDKTAIFSVNAAVPEVQTDLLGKVNRQKIYSGNGWAWGRIFRSPKLNEL